jgi:hypothetical protein
MLLLLKIACAPNEMVVTKQLHSNVRKEKTTAKMRMKEESHGPQVITALRLTGLSTRLRKAKRRCFFSIRLLPKGGKKKEEDLLASLF